MCFIIGGGPHTQQRASAAKARGPGGKPLTLGCLHRSWGRGGCTDARPAAPQRVSRRQGGGEEPPTTLRGSRGGGRGGQAARGARRGEGAVGHRHTRAGEPRATRRPGHRAPRRGCVQRRAIRQSAQPPALRQRAGRRSIRVSAGAQTNVQMKVSRHIAPRAGPRAGGGSRAREGPPNSPLRGHSPASVVSRSSGDAGGGGSRQHAPLPLWVAPVAVGPQAAAEKGGGQGGQRRGRG